MKNIEFVIRKGAPALSASMDAVKRPKLKDFVIPVLLIEAKDPPDPRRSLSLCAGAVSRSADVPSDDARPQEKAGPGEALSKGAGQKSRVPILGIRRRRRFDRVRARPLRYSGPSRARRSGREGKRGDESADRPDRQGARLHHRSGLPARRRSAPAAARRNRERRCPRHDIRWPAKQPQVPQAAWRAAGRGKRRRPACCT